MIMLFSCALARKRIDMVLSFSVPGECGNKVDFLAIGAEHPHP